MLSTFHRMNTELMDKMLKNNINVTFLSCIRHEYHIAYKTEILSASLYKLETNIPEKFLKTLNRLSKLNTCLFNVVL
jgi:hypothetical protein